MIFFCFFSLFISGFEVNVGFLGIQCLDDFLKQLAEADTEERLIDALKYKSRYSQKINDDIVKHQMKDAMKMTKPRLKDCQTNFSKKKSN